ncbi:hypothetical protein CVT24_010057 [Panaeolus cyanescens]|uniref:Uncharacterized protein n=1 Tax=Panaeolus cyanescens TaxID=181874 RepID=A0A409YW85_9AGAR|nr:hypothetical protein CVT24_010057 [Panaeolus cyanescens]
MLPISEPRPLVDSTGRICGALAGMPNDPTYLQSVDRVTEFLEVEGQALAAEQAPPGIRGPFSNVAFGLSYGGGQTKAQRLSTGKHAAFVTKIMADKDVQRIAHYADSAFQLWCPRLHAYYRETLRKAVAKTGQPANFSRSCFAATSVNVGGQVCCYKHRDCRDLAFGWCAITSFGHFNPHHGGHFVLWELKMVIEFPRGSTILVPSAAFHHSNTMIDSSEKRLSITHYTTGGLFRWVENGYMSEKQMLHTDPLRYSAMNELKLTRFKKGLAMYSTIDELCAEI